MTNDETADDLLVQSTARVVSAYLGNHVVPVRELAVLISVVRVALKATDVRPNPIAPASVEPAVAIRKSVRDDHLTCLECGSTFKTIRRHLMTHHNLTPEGYRERWALREDYPMVAPEYSRRRTEVAREIGLGLMHGKPRPK